MTDKEKRKYVDVALYLFAKLMFACIYLVTEKGNGSKEVSTEDVRPDSGSDGEATSPTSTTTLS